MKLVRRHRGGHGWSYGERFSVGGLQRGAGGPRSAGTSAIATRTRARVSRNAVSSCSSNPSITAVVVWTTAGRSRSSTACASGVTSTRTRRRSSGSVRRSMNPLRSKVSRTLVMVPLVMCTRVPTMPAGIVGTRVHITSGTMTSVLDTLERNGFIERLTDPDDRRRVLVDVTPEAQAVLDRLRPAVVQTTTAVMEGFDEQELTAFLDTLARVRVAIADVPADLGPPAPRWRPPTLNRSP